MNYKMTIQNDGARYSGWQRQWNTERTIQGRLEQSLSELLGTPTEIHGSGRTDAGVHALGQVASFQTDAPIPDCGQFLIQLNHALPSDIAVIKLDAASPRFHARLNAKEKMYRYWIWNSPIPNVLYRRMMYTVEQPLDVEAIKLAAARLVGTHDFLGFSTDHTKKSTVRHLRSVDVSSDGDLIEIQYTGNGFLRSMARIITGTLIEVGLHQRTPESILEIFESRDRSNAGFTAPAQGLCLMEVFY